MNQEIPLYRSGALGALMDEYERATTELQLLVDSLSEQTFTCLINPQASDPTFQSLQAILTHVVRAGYAYANYIRRCFELPLTREITHQLSLSEVVTELRAMLKYTAETLTDKWEMTDVEIDTLKIRSRWGVDYTLEQLLEHAIVHILRHRRQIERLVCTP